MAATRLFLAMLLLSAVACLFKDDGPVVKLTSKNFKSLVLGSDELWLVEFYGRDASYSSALVRPL